MSTLHNLPYPTYYEFIGRKKEIEDLKKDISPDIRLPVVTVDGIGGVGKTALVLEVAYGLVNSTSDSKEFDAIIFTSAKPTYLTPQGPLSELKSEKTLFDIYRVIARVLEDQAILQTPDEYQLELVKKSLEKQKTLLIVDNFDTIEEEEQKKILSFLYKQLPLTTKAIITTRKRIILDLSITLNSLPGEDCMRLIKQQAKERGIKLSPQDSKKICDRCSGIPLAIIFTIGQLAQGYPLEVVLPPTTTSFKMLTYYLFEKAMSRIKKNISYKLIMSLSFFSSPPTWEALARVADLNPNLPEVQEGMVELQQLYLVVKEGSDQYSMLSLTREYVIAEISSSANRDFEEKARERWVKWYLDYTSKYGGKDWGEDWHIKYNHLEEEFDNLIAILSWCARNDHYNDIRTLWSYLNDFASLFGHWNQRIQWTDWLITESNKRNQIQTALKAMSSKGWTLIQMGELNEDMLKSAEDILFEAWKLASDNDNDSGYNIRDSLAKHITYLFIRQRKYDNAIEWLETSKSILNKINQQEHRLRYIRSKINISYYEGEIYFHLRKYGKAKPFFQKVIKEARDCNWNRRANYALNWLADIAIQQGSLNEARGMLQRGLREAKLSKDKRRIAYYKLSFFKLEKKCNNIERAEEWKKKAIDDFERLGVKGELVELGRSVS